MSSIGSGPGIGSGSQYEVGSARGASSVNAVATPGASSAAATPQSPVQPATSASTQASAQSEAVVTTTASGGSAPVDADRVSTIKKAIQTGNYPIIPTKIGDAIIAAGLLLRTPK